MKKDPAKLTELTPWAIRIALRIAARRGQLYYKEDLAAVAVYALSRAIDAHDPAEGPLKPFASTWIKGEVHKAGNEEAGHGSGLPPALYLEELAHELLEGLLDLYTGAALRSDPEADLLRTEAAAAVRHEITLLEPDDRRLVELRYWDGLTWNEVAEQLGVAEVTAKERDHRIREHLRKALLAWDRVRVMRRGG